MAIATIVVWVLVTAGLWLLGAPLAAVLFPNAPDRGLSFSLAIVASLFIVVAYWIGHLSFTFNGMIGSLLVLATLAVIATRYSPEIPWKRGLESGLVFLTAFSLLLFIRVIDPGIYPSGGEKFLDFALLNTVIRTTTLPPVDPWFAGNSVRYYYGGHLLGAILTELTQTPPRYAYNLLVPWFYATLATTTYGLAGWLAHNNSTSYRFGGVLGVLMVAFAGNLATPARMALQFLPRDTIATLAPVLLGAIRDPLPVLIDQYAAGEFFAWNARYVIPDAPSVFPMWTFTNGDLRPHMMSAPLLVLAIALLYSYYTTPTDTHPDRYRTLGGFVLVTGALALVHTWALPTLWGLLILTLVFAPIPSRTLLPDRLRSSLESLSTTTCRHDTLTTTRWLIACVLASSTIIIGAALVFPHLLWHTPVHQGIGFLPPRSNLGGLLLVHGTFIGLFLLHYRTHIPDFVPNTSRFRTAVAILGFLLVLIGLVIVDLAAIAIFVPLLVLAWHHHNNTNTPAFASVLVIAGIGLVLIVEFTYAQVYPHDPRAPRWNTIYKVYHQTWIIWGLATAPLLTSLLTRLRPTTKRLRNRIAQFDSSHFAIVVAIILVVCSLTFGVFVTAQYASLLAETPNQPMSLSGTEYVSYEHPGEGQAILWLQEHEGQPTMVSLPTLIPYRWGDGHGASAGASLSGIPTVVGWSHEIGYRGEPAFEQRARAVDRLYTGTNNTTIRLLSKYNVDLIYMGPHERIAYGQRNFSSIPGVTVAHSSGDVTIYRVNHTRLRPQN